MTASASAPSAYHKDILKSWTYDKARSTPGIDPDGTPILNSSPSLNKSVTANLYTTSSRFLTSASYLVLKNVNLSYELPKSFVRKATLEGVTLTVTCENLFSLTSRKGMNPQQSFNGTQYNYMVTPRVFSVGANIKF